MREIVYEVWRRPRTKKGKKKTSLRHVITFQGAQHWQRAVKLHAKLVREDESAEVILRELTVTNETVTKRAQS